MGSVGLRYHKQGQVMQDDAVNVVLVSVPLQSKGEQEEKENPELPQTTAWDFASPPWHCPGLARLIPGEGSSVTPVCAAGTSLWFPVCVSAAVRELQGLHSVHQPVLSPGFLPGAVEHRFILPR